MNSSRARHRIAILVPGGVGEASSGMHIPALRNLIVHLADDNDVSVYSLARPDWKEIHGVCGKARVVFLPTYHRGGAATKVWRLIRSCLNDHKTMPFDIVHGFWAIPCGVAAVLLGRYLHIPSVVTFMGGETACLPEIGYGNMARFSTRQATLQVGKLADALVLLAHHQEIELRQFGCIRNNSVNVIPFGVDTSRFVPREKDLSVHPLRFLHVSNINPLKDQTTLLHTFRLVCEKVDARLRIVGDDQSGGSIRQLTVDLGLADRVEFVGHVPHTEMPRQYEWAHFLIHSSRHEAGVIVVVEAAASGVPVAGTRTGLIADFGDDLACTADVGDYETLARKILDVVSRPDRYADIRRASLNWAQLHNASWSVSQYLSLYNRLPASRTKAPA